MDWRTTPAAVGGAGGCRHRLSIDLLLSSQRRLTCQDGACAPGSTALPIACCWSTQARPVRVLVECGLLRSRPYSRRGRGSGTTMGGSCWWLVWSSPGCGCWSPSVSRSGASGWSVTSSPRPPAGRSPRQPSKLWAIAPTRATGHRSRCSLGLRQQRPARRRARAKTASHSIRQSIHDVEGNDVPYTGGATDR